MKKRNKILMAVIAILLCLVLLSTSLVSGIFAKFVIRKSGSTTIKFDKFGVSLHVSGDDATPTIVNNGKNATITYAVHNMNPDVTFDDVIRFAFDGQQTVPIDVTVKVDVTTHSNFLLDTSEFGSLQSSTAYMPLLFKVGTVANKDTATCANVTSTDAWISGSTTAALDLAIEQAIAAQIAVAMDVEDSNTADSSVTKSFAKTAPIVFKDNAKGIGFGFAWSMGNDSSTSPTDALHNAIENYLANQFAATDNPITITFTVSVEQTGA